MRVCLFCDAVTGATGGLHSCIADVEQHLVLERDWADVKISPRVLSRTATIKPERGDVMQQLELTKVLIRPYP